MTSKELLLNLIKRQKQQAWKSGDWDKLEAEVKTNEDGDTIIYVGEVKVGFAFDKNGRFCGIFNWQE